MASVNKWHGVGRLTADPETRDSQKTDITTFTIAVDRYAGGGEKKADFFRCVTFGKTAEFAKQYLSKGSLIYAEGRIEVDQVEKDGVSRTYVSFPLNTIQSLSSPAERKPAGYADKEKYPAKGKSEDLYGDDNEDPWA